MVSPSATATDLTDEGPASRSTGSSVTTTRRAGGRGKYMKDVLKAQKVFLRRRRQTYGRRHRRRGQEGPRPARSSASDKVQEKQTNFDGTSPRSRAPAPTRSFYGGYTNEAAPLLKQFRAAGVTAKFLGFDGLYDPAFPKGAGDAEPRARS